MKRPFSWSSAVPPRIWRALATPTRPAPKPSRKPRLQSASARYICDPRPGENWAGTTRMMRRLLQPIWVLLAIIFLVEAWLWDHLEPIVAWFVALIPLRAFKEWLAEQIDTLSPAMTLIVFIVPVIPLFPLKLVGLWLLTHEYWISAILTIIFAKFVGVGVAAFIFDVTRHKLLEMQWFETLYEFIIELRAKASALVDPIKLRIREALGGGGDGWSSRMLRLIQRFRKHV